MSKEMYLGDGLYASWDGMQIQLRAPRDSGDHVVFLDEYTLQNFIQFVNTLPREPTHHETIIKGGDVVNLNTGKVVEMEGVVESNVVEILNGLAAAARDEALAWLLADEHGEGYPRSREQEARNTARRGYDAFEDEATPIAGYEVLEREGRVVRIGTVNVRGEERVHFKLKQQEKPNETN